MECGVWDQVADELTYALDPVAFARDKLRFEPDEVQAEVLGFGGKRLILNCTRQWGKSTIIAIKALHKAVYKRKALVLMLSASLRQSGILFGKVRNAIADAGDRLGIEVTQMSALSCELSNGSKIISLPGSEETVRGYSGPDMVIEDEAAMCSDALYKAIRPMLAVSGGALILMSTPHGKRGHFYEAWNSSEGGWRKISVTADQCPRISRDFLAEEYEALGDLWFRQEYHCEFVETEDQVFSTDDIASIFIEESADAMFGADSVIDESIEPFFGGG